MTEIVERLRKAADPARIRGTEIGFAAMDAANEIDRLRALITQLADAEQGDSEKAWSDALTFLYQAVGR